MSPALVLMFLYFPVRPELGWCGHGKQDNSPSLWVRGAGSLQTSPFGSSQQIPGPCREYWGGGWSGGSSSSNETNLLHARPRRPQSPGKVTACHVIDNDTLRRPSRPFLTLDWSTCLALILSSLQPVCLVTLILSQFIKALKLIVKMRMLSVDKLQLKLQLQLKQEPSTPTNTHPP